jgi:hypothetical protein
MHLMRSRIVYGGNLQVYVVESLHEFIINYGWFGRVQVSVIWYNLIISYEPFLQQALTRNDMRESHVPFTEQILKAVD